MTYFLAIAVPGSADDPLGTGGALADAWQVNNWWLVAVLAAVLLVWALRKFSGWLSGRVDALSFLAWFGTKAGGRVLGFVVPFLLALSTSLTAGAKMSVSLVISSVSAGVGAAGLFGTRKLPRPNEKKQ